MIDIESELFTAVATVLRTEYPGIYVANDNISKTATFPAVTIVEMDNSVYQPGIDSGEIENFATLMYQVDVYSNKSKGRRAECKAIANLIDAQMAGMGFVRTFRNPTPNMHDSTIYRMTVRYRGVADKNKTIYRG